MSTLNGKVKWFNGKKGYGFIEREDKEKDVFVHASAVRDAGLRFLNEGDELQFEIEDGPKGPSAVKLQKKFLLRWVPLETNQVLTLFRRSCAPATPETHLKSKNYSTFCKVIRSNFDCNIITLQYSNSVLS